MITKDTEIQKTDGALRKAIYIVFDGKCFYTGRQVTFEEMHIDHIYPKIKGGKDCIANYVLCCPYMNFKKNDIIHDKLMQVSYQCVQAFFVEKVVALYNNITSNVAYFNTHIEINTFLDKQKNGNQQIKEYFRNFLRTKLVSIKLKPYLQNGKTGVKNRLYYDKKEIQEEWNKYLIKHNCK